MKPLRLLLCLALATLVALPLWAQANPTAKVSGRVTSSDGELLPGVTVTLQSPALQGTRIAATDENGAYVAPPVAPGEYEITFQLEGYQTLTRRVRLSANMALQVDAQLPLSTVAEEIVVTGEAVETISQDQTTAQTILQKDLELVAGDRTFEAAVLFAPGVHNTGPASNTRDGRDGASSISISGSQSWENLFTLNGVVLNENIRGQSFDLYIEDAIQETTVASGGVSAEWGRFTGGVVTAITKSGGNRFEGSVRMSYDNEDWKSDNEFSPETRQDKTNDTLEATVGGRIVKDRLWFFGAYRDRETESTATTSILNLEYPTTNAEDRTEYKLTAALTPSHQLQGNLLEINEDQFNVAHGGLTSFAATIDDGSIDPVRSLPQDLLVANYTGVITSNFFIEAQYGEREFTFEGTGGQDQDLETGTPVFDLVNSVVTNESLFCDSTAIDFCNPEERDNEQGRIKASYFLSTENAGSHDLAFGYETFTDIRSSDNHQSPNDLMIWNFVATEFVGTEDLVPLDNNFGTFLTHLPVLEPSQPSDFAQDSFFLNDRWRLNDKWSFNIGVRYDQSDSVNSSKLKVADADEFSPRLGATFDLRGDGKHVFHATAARYVGQTTSGIFGDTSVAGVPAIFGFVYLGPVSGLFPAEQANRIGYDWLASVCPDAIDFSNTFVIADPFSCPFLAIVDVPGATEILAEDLTATSADEFTFGYQRDLGRRGRIRFDVVHREFGNFFMTKKDLETGQGQTPGGSPFDLGVVVNEDNLLRRDYDALSVAWNTRFLDSRLRVGGNATWSHARGNLDGETSGSGPVTSSVGEYPEYVERRWNSPDGDLGVDQRLIGRVWVLYDILRTDNHLLNVSMVETIFSGGPYSAVRDINPVPFVDNPGYITPDNTRSYFFSGRGEFTTDDGTQTDLALNYSFNLGRFEIFVQPEVLNLFNEDAVLNVNQAVSQLASFDPFTETPVEGVHWRKGANFGLPTEEDDLQDVREYRFSVGLRWNP